MKYGDGLVCTESSWPRSQSHLKTFVSMQVKVSYLEIYNEIGYDLLDPERNIAKIEDLRRVQAFEMDDGIVYFRHLAVQPVSSEEDALNLVVVVLLPAYASGKNPIPERVTMLHASLFGLQKDLGALQAYHVSEKQLLAALPRRYASRSRQHTGQFAELQVTLYFHCAPENRTGHFPGLLHHALCYVQMHKTL